MTAVEIGIRLNKMIESELKSQQSSCWRFNTKCHPGSLFTYFYLGFSEFQGKFTREPSAHPKCNATSRMKNNSIAPGAQMAGQTTRAAGPAGLHLIWPETRTSACLRVVEEHGPTRIRGNASSVELQVGGGCRDPGVGTTHAGGLPVLCVDPSRLFLWSYVSDLGDVVFY